MIPQRKPGGIYHFPGPSSLQESRTRTGIGQHPTAPTKAEIQSRFCSHCSREMPVVLNRNFTADLRNWVMFFLLSAFSISV